MSNDSRHSADHHEYARRHRADHDATLPIKPPIHIGIFDDGVIGRMSAGQHSGISFKAMGLKPVGSRGEK